MKILGRNLKKKLKIQKFAYKIILTEFETKTNHKDASKNIKKNVLIKRN